MLAKVHVLTELTFKHFSKSWFIAYNSYAVLCYKETFLWNSNVYGLLMIVELCPREYPRKRRLLQRLQGNQQVLSEAARSL